MRVLPLSGLLVLGLAAQHAPQPWPDRLILTLAGDPASSIGVTWRTHVSIKRSFVEIAPSEDGPAFPKKANRVEASTESLKTDLGEANYHSVRVSGLQPDTLYAYRAGSGEHWSEWHQFRTAKTTRAPVTLLYVGDAQTNIFSLWSRLIRMGFATAPQAQFIVHAGDLINRSDRDAEWGEWHQAAGWINGTIPSFPSPGNHEYGKTDKGRALTAHWRPQFTLPENGVTGLEESNYFIDYQGVRMVSLNSNEKQKEQAAWLDRVLSQSPQPWTLLTFHHPILSAARERDNKELRELWQPVIDKHAVDMVLTGHDHTYARSNVMTGLNAQKGRAGTVYVVSVSGPKMYNLARQKWMERTAEDTQLFQVIRIDGDQLFYESRTARGVLYDSFELRKQPGKPNRLISRIPAGVTERRRPPEEKK